VDRRSVQRIADNTELRRVLKRRLLPVWQKGVDLLGLPLGTVMSRLHRGRAHLRALLMDVAASRGYAA
jgi:hypothetical protein